MISKRTLILMVAVVLLMATIWAGAAAGQSGTEDVDPDEIPEQVVRDLLDEDGRIFTTDDRLARVAREHKGGFGGYYFHETNRSKVYVYMLDPDDIASAEAAFRAAYRGKRQITQVIPVQGDYSFDQLLEWFRVLDSALVQEGIYPATGATLEIANRIMFGLEDMSQVEDAHRIMKDFGIPQGAVLFQEAHPELLDGGDNVDDKWRPLVGGIQHQIKLGQPGHCTIGFVTERAGVDGVILASHCTNDDGDIGGVDNAKISQPLRGLIISNRVAVETIDPYLHTFTDNDQCPEDYRCRYSDAAFAKLDSGQSLDLGHVAKPEGVGETDVFPDGTTFEIIREASGVGDEIYYVGATEGWRTGDVIDDCTYFQVRPPVGSDGIRIICVGHAVVNDGGGWPSGGDSGATVIASDDEEDVEVDLVGVLFGRNSAQFYFARVGFIYYELGASETWNSCTSEC